MKKRLDQAMKERGLVSSRSQAASFIRMGKVKLNGKEVRDSGMIVDKGDKIILAADEQYVSRAAHKLDSVTSKLGLDFANRTVLDVGSSTGGFSQFALLRGAKKVIAVDVGTNQLHPVLRTDDRIELHEKTDILDVFIRKSGNSNQLNKVWIDTPDIILADVSFVSLKELLPHIAQLMMSTTELVVMVKPQFEARPYQLNQGVVKNEYVRRKIFKEFESWARGLFKVLDKSDAKVSGMKGNTERFYLLKLLPRK